MLHHAGHRARRRRHPPRRRQHRAARCRARTTRDVTWWAVAIALALPRLDARARRRAAAQPAHRLPRRGAPPRARDASARRARRLGADDDGGRVTPAAADVPALARRRHAVDEARASRCSARGVARARRRTDAAAARGDVGRRGDARGGRRLLRLAGADRFYRARVRRQIDVGMRYAGSALGFLMRECAARRRGAARAAWRIRGSPPPTSSSACSAASSSTSSASSTRSCRCSRGRCATAIGWARARRRPSRRPSRRASRTCSSR